jgi:hypothetical protein
MSGAPDNQVHRPTLGKCGAESPHNQSIGIDIEGGFIACGFHMGIVGRRRKWPGRGDIVRSSLTIMTQCLFAPSDVSVSVSVSVCVLRITWDEWITTANPSVECLSGDCAQ